MNKEKLIELIKTDIETVLKPKLEEQIEKTIKIASVIYTEGQPNSKKYLMYGSGCGFAWIVYDKRKKYLTKVIETYENILIKYKQQFKREFIEKYKIELIGALLDQDIDIRHFYKQSILNFAKNILKLNVGNAYACSRLD